MRASLLLLLAGLCAACGPGQGNPLAPIGDPHKVSPAPAPPPLLGPTPPPLIMTVTGPSGCVEASTLPDPVVWIIEHIPVGVSFIKAYHFDSHVNCDPTEQNRSTENDHLRIIRTEHDAVRVEFDLNENLCLGRQQPDVSERGIDGKIWIGMTIKRSDGKACKPVPPKPVPPVPVPPTLAPPPVDECPPGTVIVFRDGDKNGPPVCEAPPPARTPPPPPPPPVPAPLPAPRPPCAAVNPPAFDSPHFTRTDRTQPIEASVHVANGATWTFVLYASHPGHEPYRKDIAQDTLACGESGTLRVSYPWMTHPSREWWTVLYRNGVVVYTSPKVTR